MKHKHIRTALLCICSLHLANLFLIDSAKAQGLSKYTFRLNETKSSSGLASNTVTEAISFNETLWFGTGVALSRTRDEGRSFETFGRVEGIGKGGISAMALSDEIIWVATGFDTTTDLGRLDAGGGLAYSRDDGNSWNHVQQPGDTITTINNITFDMALRGDEVWITSFAGGLRKSTDFGEVWEIVSPDSFIFDVNATPRLNHRAFSVAVVDSILWVGTAGGINRSTDGGETWTNFNHANQADGISGNFVVAIARQSYRGRSIIWAATRETSIESGDDTELRGISWSEDQGFSWRTALMGQTIHNIAFDDSVVYAASDAGLHKSIDFGETWALFPGFVNSSQTRQILTHEVFDAAVTSNHTLWVATANGLAKTTDNAFSWEIFQIFAPTGTTDQPRTYAYPNPFSPAVHNQFQGQGHVRFQYNTTVNTRVTLKIYDFSMQHVKTVVDGFSRPAAGDFYETWNGLDENGRQVANGVYFYRLDMVGDGTHWGKLIVLE